MSKYLITSALPYINGVKHLGNLAGSMLPADVHARFRRLQGHDVLFICATDEHGTPAELAAADAGLDVRSYCDEQYRIQRDIYSHYRLSFDWFGRSSNPPNHMLTQHLCDRLEAAGLVEERMSQQIYSVDDGRFLPDRYVEGTCPVCGYDRARGDQCDNCGTLLDPVDLINPRSKISGSTNLELRETAHLFLLQSKMRTAIRAWVDSAHEWPPLARSIAYKWLNEGLQDRAITRDLSWGIPVMRHGRPRPGFEHKVFYVWFDAPIEYIGATFEWAQATGGDWEHWWRRDKGADDVVYVQFMGKDNVAFHTVSFPATLIGSREPWKLVDRLKAFNWVTWYGGKFSTSEKRGVFMDDALELLPSDYWRWRLMVNSPEGADSAFTWEDFRNGINADLVNVLGNFVNRVMKFAETRFDSIVPAKGTMGVAEHHLSSELKTRLTALTRYHEAMEFRKAAVETRAIWVLGNEYLHGAAPWTTIKTNREAANTSVNIGLNLCALFATIASPFIPDTADAIFKALHLVEHPPWPFSLYAAHLDLVRPGGVISAPPVLFRRIDESDIQKWRNRFGGDRSNDAAEGANV
jgi:methionyl-tRNA synthetase